YALSCSPVTVSVDGGRDVDVHTCSSPAADISITDDGGADQYTESGQGTVLIDDNGNSSGDTYALSGSTVTVTDDGGSDVYNITGDRKSVEKGKSEDGGADQYTENGQSNVV